MTYIGSIAQSMQSCIRMEEREVGVVEWSKLREGVTQLPTAARCRSIIGGDLCT